MSERTAEQTCDNCGKLKQSHREVDGELLCYPDTFPEEAMIFRVSEWKTCSDAAKRIKEGQQ